MAGSRQRWGRVGLWVYSTAVFAFLVLPMGIIIPLSFSPQSYLRFPLTGYSFRWYLTFFQDPTWISAALLSLRVACMVVAMSVCLGFLAALALLRHRFSGKAIVRVLLLTPLIVPAIVVAIAVYSLYVKLHLVGTVIGIVLAHTVLVLPFAVMLLAAGLERLDRRLEEASYTMGATSWQTFHRITLPILGPSIFAAALFAFVFSFDEVVMVIFVGGLIGETLPLKMFSFMQTEISPLLAAVSTLLLLLIVVVQTSLAFVGGRKSIAGTGETRRKYGQVHIPPTSAPNREPGGMDHIGQGGWHG